LKKPKCRNSNNQGNLIQQANINLKIFIGFAISLLLQTAAFAQEKTKVQILDGERITTIMNDSVFIRSIVGHVKIKSENTIMHCDSAALQPLNNILEAFGNVHIIQADTLNIYSDYLKYEGNLDDLFLQGNVSLEKDDLTLYTDQLHYNIANDLITYNQGAELKDSVSTLTSKKGYFNSKTQMAFFKDSVRLTGKNYDLSSDTLEFNTKTKTAVFHGPTTIHSEKKLIYCEKGWYDTKNDIASFTQNASLSDPPTFLKADSIYFNKPGYFGQGFGNIEMHDTAQQIILYGQRVDYWELTNRIIAFENPVVVNISGGDSLFIAADTIISVEDSTGNYRMSAYYDVQIYRNDLQGICDSLYYNRADSVLSLFHDPVLWSDSNQFSADTIHLFFANDKLNKIKLVDHAFLASVNDTLVYNQINGRLITGFFEQDTLRHLNVDGNAQSIYYMQDDQKKYVGVNKIQCASMVIRLEKNQLSQIRFRGEPSGTMYPIQKINTADFILEGFEWKGGLRPESSQVLFDL
jgi:lipopolysaccharide assembly outer membrane protein LptD (OstA)